MPAAVTVVAIGVIFASADPAVVAPVPPLAKARGVVESVSEGAVTAPAKVAAPVEPAARVKAGVLLYAPVTNFIAAVADRLMM